MYRSKTSTVATLFWVLYSAIAGGLPPVTFGIAAVTVLTSCKKAAKTVKNATNPTTPTVQPGTPTVGQPQ